MGYRCSYMYIITEKASSTPKCGSHPEMINWATPSGCLAFFTCWKYHFVSGVWHWKFDLEGFRVGVTLAKYHSQWRVYCWKHLLDDIGEICIGGKYIGETTRLGERIHCWKHPQLGWKNNMYSYVLSCGMNTYWEHYVHCRNLLLVSILWRRREYTVECLVRSLQVGGRIKP